MNKRYFTGNPCKNGHVVERLISNRGCIECARVKKLKWAADNLDMLLERKRLDRIDNPEKHQMYEKARYQQDSRFKMLTAAKQRAKLKNLPFDLTIDDLNIPEICPLLNIPLTVALNKTTGNSPSLDRIDNKKGYTKDNILIISWRANRCKTDMSLTELFTLADNLKKLALEKGFI